MKDFKYGVVETFFKTKRWTAYVIRKPSRKGIFLCGHKHHSRHAAEQCVLEMLMVLRTKGWHGKPNDRH